MPVDDGKSVPPGRGAAEPHLLDRTSSSNLTATSDRELVLARLVIAPRTANRGLPRMSNLWRSSDRDAREARIGKATYPMMAGDFVACPAAEAEIARRIANTGTEELRFLTSSAMRSPGLRIQSYSMTILRATLFPPCFHIGFTTNSCWFN